MAEGNNQSQKEDPHLFDNSIDPFTGKTRDIGWDEALKENEEFSSSQKRTVEETYSLFNQIATTPPEQYRGH
jgi:hypothetical protein